MASPQEERILAERRRHRDAPFDVHPLRDAESSDLDFSLFREACWYADRLEIISPGGPFGQVTPENFGQPGINDYRNPHLAEAMHTLGYAQHFGVGIQIARETLARNGNPPLEFRVDSRTVVATIRRMSAKAP